MTALLELKNIHKSFGEQQVLKGLNLSLNQGDILGLLGPNGCGKSTLLNIIAQLIVPDAGEVCWAGPAPTARLRHTTLRVGFCSQRCALYPDLRPAENLMFFARLHGLSKAASTQRVAELMQAFSLSTFAQTRAGQLSGGWQQRLHLAISLVHRPQLLVLDEPTAAVDVQARRDLWRLIEGLRDEGTTILMTSHHLAEAERLCSQIAVMRHGKLAAQGSVPELLAELPGKVVAKVQSDDHETLRQLASERGWPLRQLTGETKLYLPSNTGLRDVIEALEDAKLTSVSVLAVSLDDVYGELLSEDALGA